MRRIGLGVLVVLAGAGLGCGSNEATTSRELIDMLGRAQAGDTVQVAEGRFEGRFEVPSGVTLRGAGRDATILVGLEGEPAVVIVPSAAMTTVSDLGVESGPRSTAEEGTVVRDPDTDAILGLEFVEERREIGVLARGEGRVTIERVDVSVGTGIGIGIEELDSLVLHDVMVLGSVTSANVDRLPTYTQAENTSAYGVVVLSSGSVEIDALEVSGFAVSGVQIVDSETQWADGRICENLGTSLLVSGGTTTLDTVELCNMLQGFSLIPPYGLAVTAGAELDTTDLSIVGNGDQGGESIGFLQDSSMSVHRGLEVRGNNGIGVQVQRSQGTLGAPAFHLQGSGNELTNNAFVGLVVLESSGILVDDALIAGTRLLPMTVEDLSGVEVGDGMQIVRCGDPAGTCTQALTDITFTRLSLEDNERAGMLVEAYGGSAAGVVCGEILVGTGGEFGAVSQNHTEPPTGWTEIDRTGAPRELEAVGNVNPEFLPASALDLESFL